MKGASVQKFKNRTNYVPKSNIYEQMQITRSSRLEKSALQKKVNRRVYFRSGGFRPPKNGPLQSFSRLLDFFSLLLKNPFTEGGELATPYLAHIPFGLAITEGFS
jgi:hypothetical protein